MENVIKYNEKNSTLSVENEGKTTFKKGFMARRQFKKLQKTEIILVTKKHSYKTNWEE